jgi:hypothetical protein
VYCPNCGAPDQYNTFACSQCNTPLPAFYPPQPQFYGQPQPPYFYYYYPPKVTHPAEKIATASMVCGIVGIVSILGFGFVLGIIAIVLGRNAKRRGFTGGQATAGVALGIINVSFWAFLFLVVFLISTLR